MLQINNMIGSDKYNVIKECLGVMIKTHYEYGYQVEIFYQNTNGGILIQHGFKRNIFQ